MDALVETSSFPHYYQQLDNTCGPACLLMIFKHFDQRFEMSKRNEIDIWRESSLAPLPPTSRYGLAFAALKRGHPVEILSNVEGVEINQNPALLGEQVVQALSRFQALAATQFEERKERALELGLEERIVEKIEFEAVHDVVSRGGVPIMLTSARHFDDDDWIHWVVVTGANSQNILINDPGSVLEKGRRIFQRREFDSINGYYGHQVLVSIFPRK